MKRVFALLLIAVLLFATVACSERNEDAAHTETDGQTTERKTIAPVGTVPEEFQAVVSENLFYGVQAFQNCLLKANYLSEDSDHHTREFHVEKLDLYGHRLASYKGQTSDAHNVRILTATEDGGFLFLLGFVDFAYSQDEWASDKGIVSYVIKCDQNGEMQWKTTMNGMDDEALRYCFERNGSYYLFGTIETPETKTRGVYSPSDIHMAILDDNGALLQTAMIGGSDYDSLHHAEATDDGFLLSLSSQSDDGDFSDSGSNGYPTEWVILVDNDLKIMKKQKESGRDFSDTRIGERDGKTIYQSDLLLKEFDAGSVQAFIDYGSFYLLISERVTGEYEHTPPYVSSTWNNTETVYSAFDNNGTLLFRASTDSSPDYDSLLERY